MDDSESRESMASSEEGDKSSYSTTSSTTTNSEEGDEALVEVVPKKKVPISRQIWPLPEEDNEADVDDLEPLLTIEPYKMTKRAPLHKPVIVAPYVKKTQNKPSPYRKEKKNRTQSSVSREDEEEEEEVELVTEEAAAVVAAAEEEMRMEVVEEAVEEDEETSEEENAAPKKQRKRKPLNKKGGGGGAGNKTKKAGVDEVEELVHCVGRIKLLIGEEEEEKVYLVLSTHTNKIYCVTLDRISECLECVLFEHTVVMVSDASVDANNKYDLEDTVQINYFTNNIIYRVTQWKSQKPRIILPSNGGEPLFKKIAKLIGQTLFFRSIFATTTIDPYEDEEGGDEEEDEEPPMARVKIVDPAYDKWLKTYRRLFPCNNKNNKKKKGNTKSTAAASTGNAKKGTDQVSFWRHIDAEFDTNGKVLRQLYNVIPMDYAPSKKAQAVDNYSGTSTMKMEHLVSAISNKETSSLFVVAKSLCKHALSMNELHYLCKTLGPEHVRSSFPIASKSETEIADLYLFVKGLEMLGTNTQRMFPVQSLDPAPFHNYSAMWVSIGTHLQLFITQVFKRYKYSTDVLAMIKHNIIKHIVVPRIIGDIDKRAGSSHTHNHATTFLITLDMVISLYTELLELPYTSTTSAGCDLNGDTLTRILEVIEHCEGQTKGVIMERVKLSTSTQEDAKLVLGIGDLPRIVDHLYLPCSDPNEPVRHPGTSYYWRILMPTRPLSFQEAVPKKMPLFMALLDLQLMCNENALQEEFKKLRIGDPGACNFVHSISNFLATAGDNNTMVDPVIERLESYNFSMILSSALDVLKFRDMDLMVKLLENDYYHTMVVLPGDNDYIRAMISRYLTLRNKVNVPSFHAERTVTCDNLKIRFPARGKMQSIKYLFMPYANLWSSSDLLKTLKFVAIHRKKISHLVFTGCIDILPTTKGQPFIDMLRAIENKAMNRLIFSVDRQVTPFNELVDTHWEVSRWGDCTPDKVGEFMALFNRMTFTVCSSYRKLCCVNNFGVICYLTHNVLARMSNIKKYHTAYGRVDSLTIHINSRRMADYSRFRNMMRDKLEKSLGILKISLHFSSFKLGAVHTPQRSHVMDNIRMTHKRSENCDRHLYLITMNELITEASRHELTTLFTMSDNLIVIDKPDMGSDSVVKPRWNSNPSFVKNAIKKRFKECTHFTTRYTSASYCYEYENKTGEEGEEEEEGDDDDDEEIAMNISHDIQIEEEEEEEEEETTEERRPSAGKKVHAK